MMSPFWLYKREASRVKALKKKKKNLEKAIAKKGLEKKNWEKIL